MREHIHELTHRREMFATRRERTDGERGRAIDHRGDPRARVALRQRAIELRRARYDDGKRPIETR